MGDSFKVEDVINNAVDSTGETITTVYSKVHAVYAVYGTAARIMVQFADDDKLGKEQRLALAPLNPLRGEINGLIDGWRSSGRFTAKSQARARCFDRRTADALTIALQGDNAHAIQLLQDIKSDIYEERVSIGRSEYLVVAGISAVAVFTLVASATRLFPGASWSSFISDNNILVAIAIGSLGALFSIALSIRSRSIKPDLQRRDNVVDAMLRILIGAVSAVVLFSLFKSGLVSLTLGKTQVDPVGADPAQTHAAIIAAFLAGFSERLVGDFLSSTALGSLPGSRSASETAGSESGIRKLPPGADERNPLGERRVKPEASEDRGGGEASADDEAPEAGGPAKAG